jgi:TolB-like protein/Tfp pilus assembly protein PilF
MLSQGQRRLAAIMFTDMVGYTALGQRNELLSLALVDEQRKLIRPILTRHNGREVKTIGDAFLVEFPSALDALRCAYDIQRATREFNFSLPEDRRIHLRVGVHLGDVVESQGDISGDAVNVASRIESLAEDGGVCLTREVYNQVKNKFELPMESIGAKALKNVDSSMEVFKIVMPWGKGPTEPVSLLDTKRIAVLPFASMSPDPNDEYFADGLTEELIDRLCQVRELGVIARTSVMNYKKERKNASQIGRELKAGGLVEGSVRKSGNRIRVTAQLINANNEEHLWSSHYDKNLDDIFAVQSDIAEQVVGALKVQLLPDEKRAIEKKATANTEAYTLYLKGRYHWNFRTKKEVEKAIEYFQLAVDQDPGFALGFSGLADCYSVMGRNGLADPVVAYPRAKEFAMKALELDEKLAEAHAALASVTLYYDHEYVKSETEFKRAIELKPSYSTAHQWYFHLLAVEGRFSEALEQTSRAVELDPISAVVTANHGDAYFWLDEYEKAVEQYKKVLTLQPKWDWPWMYLTYTYTQMSAFDKALQSLERFGEVSGKPLETKLHRAELYCAMGRKAESKILLDEVKGRYKEEAISPYLIGAGFISLGEADEGFEWLEKAYQDRDPWLVWVGVDKDMKDSRSDSRYRSLLDRIGLTKHLTRK